MTDNVGAGDGEHAAVVARPGAFVGRLSHAHHGAEDALLWPKLHERTPPAVRSTFR